MKKPIVCLETYFSWKLGGTTCGSEMWKNIFIEVFMYSSVKWCLDCHKLQIFGCVFTGFTSFSKFLRFIRLNVVLYLNWSMNVLYQQSLLLLMVLTFVCYRCCHRIQCPQDESRWSGWQFRAQLFLGGTHLCHHTRRSASW